MSVQVLNAEQDDNPLAQGTCILPFASQRLPGKQNDATTVTRGEKLPCARADVNEGAISSFSIIKTCTNVVCRAGGGGGEALYRDGWSAVPYTVLGSAFERRCLGRVASFADI